MQILYVISSIFIIVLAILLKKSKEKIDIVTTIILIFILKIAYNTLICYILNLLDIPITLINLSIVNFIISLILLIIIFKDKEIQKYKINKTNIISLIVLLFITILVTAINFNNLTKIRYISMDSREHYKVAREFSENTQLTNKATENNTSSKLHMPIGYTNVGIAFKVFKPYIGTVQLYKIYIILEAFTYLLTGYIFYLIIHKYLKSYKEKIIGLIFCIIYMLGYPLNAWISGFHYLLFGILYVGTIIYIFSNYDKYDKEDVLDKDKKDNKLIKIVSLFLVNIGLIFSYSLFCPFCYLAEFIYLIYKCIKEKKYKDLILKTVITLIIPGIVGITYILIPLFSEPTGSIALEGWIYKNFWSNFILFIPFTIYAIYKNIKNKEIKFDSIIFLSLILYMIVLFIGIKLGKVSEYYFYKCHFILWIMLLLYNIKGMMYLFENKTKRFIVYLYVAFYLILFVILGWNIKTYADQKNTDKITQTMQIFSFNKTMMFLGENGFMTKNEMDLLKRLDLEPDINYKDKEQIVIITNPNEEQWLEGLTGYNNKYRYNSEEYIKNIMEPNYKYICTFENKETYDYLKKDIHLDNYELIYENPIGKIYKKKGI